jgi:ribosomal-protein-alanine N-acetyltransferase
VIETRIKVRLRPMRLSDIPQVTAIDRLCFPTPWPAHSYRYELTQSRTSSLFALTSPEAAQPSNGIGLSSLVNRLRFGFSGVEHIVGYSGFWFITDEVHISTIAVHPDWQGRHLGELLLFAMLRQAVRKGAQITTLEVRVSNTLAQNLYRKYGFEIVTRRKGYYRDNREDAWMMSVRSSEQAYVNWLKETGAALFQQLDVIDEWV